MPPDKALESALRCFVSLFCLLFSCVCLLQKRQVRRLNWKAVAGGTTNAIYPDSLSLFCVFVLLRLFLCRFVVRSAQVTLGFIGPSETNVRLPPKWRAVTIRR